MILSLLGACAADEDTSCTGDTVTLQAKQGVSFADGCVQTPGNFLNSDLYVTQGAPYLKLAPGGTSSVNTVDVRWSTPSTYNSLAEVPDTLPNVDSTSSLPQAKTGIGFVIKNHTTDGYTKGWIQDGAPETGYVTIQFTPLANER